MAWDIYGNPLQRGHCEVHPHVHEEYPCSVCMSERGQTQQPHDALQQLQYEFAQQGDYIKQLEAERDALAAQVEAIAKDRDDWKNAMARAASVLLLHKVPTKTIDVDKALAEIRAEAGRAGYLKGADDWKSFEQVFDSDIEDSANEYAESVRQGGAE